jgi:carboxyl-terminal processing protease
MGGVNATFTDAPVIDARLIDEHRGCDDAARTTSLASRRGCGILSGQRHRRFDATMARKVLRYVIPAAAIALIPAANAVFAANEAEQAPAASADTYKQLDTLMDVFERVRAEYVDKVDDKTLIEGAINGMLASLDPHSSYLNARDFQQMRTTTDGEYGGLGLTVSMEDGVVKVVSPTDDTPASRAGMKAGDFITHIDGELLYGVTLNEAVDKMRGAPGTPIKLTVVREGTPKPMELTLKREVIQIKPVRFEAKGNVGLIRISAFN